MIDSHRELAAKLEAMEQKYDQQFDVVYEILNQLNAPPPDEEPKNPIGFIA
ncbi:MAG: hypothetical protein WDO73_02480 [Ignavibacteriota bacterium]